MEGLLVEPDRLCCGKTRVISGKLKVKAYFF